MFLLYNGLETHFDLKFSNKGHPVMEKVVIDEEQKYTELINMPNILM